ncbi:hypothetical protein N5J06_01800 [Ralstonia sp. CHL-2022]|uniref:Lipoprotein n=2 Tax=Ralstonia mojiangensis TaxID=2953895 RepID=A0AAE3LB35_9RALS|nr:hypothetical protein [Ralstonia mojiangensis]MCO5412821.1 hypothetical protein [Ralstonia mojiangensis]MCT7297156.1 hypothetical protein [Ralstonia mojiangensis]MCT7309664.1 hypothetical protein [Ralstonia mojiangensis]MCT7316714.1 hypothetical protein [Ralstonia mojiangensis]MCT7328069.1 hypothetical protein [Ralstonia mojiangensis]
MRKPMLHWAVACIAMACLSACAPMISTAPAMLSTDNATGPSRIQLKSATEIRLETGYTRTLAAGSNWQRVGTLSQGAVYRPVGTIFTIEGRQVHEAYLVIASQRLVGFYLPGEQAYSPLSTAVSITTGESQ